MKNKKVESVEVEVEKMIDVVNNKIIDVVSNKMNHPLMTCEMNLLEISHRDIEKIEKKKLEIVGKSIGDAKADVEAFKEFLLSHLVKWNV